MNIHEYQAKELLAKFGVAVPKGIAAMSVEEAVAAAKQLPGPLYVVKSQIHAGGRGKGKFKELGPRCQGRRPSGPKFNLDEVEAHAKEMLGNTLVTIQTGAEGKQVNRLYITDGADIKQEFYLALLVDRATSRIAVVASTEGGMNIEDVAHDTPEKIHTITIDPASGLMPHHGRSVAKALGLTGDLAKAMRQKVLSWTLRRISSAPMPSRSKSIRSRCAKARMAMNCWCSMPRSVLMATPCSATRIWPNCAT